MLLGINRSTRRSLVDGRLRKKKPRDFCHRPHTSNWCTSEYTGRMAPQSPSPYPLSALVGYGSVVFLFFQANFLSRRTKSREKVGLPAHPPAPKRVPSISLSPPPPSSQSQQCKPSLGLISNMKANERNDGKKERLPSCSSSFHFLARFRGANTDWKLWPKVPWKSCGNFVWTFSSCCYSHFKTDW